MACRLSERNKPTSADTAMKHHNSDFEPALAQLES